MTVFHKLSKMNWIGDILTPLSVILMETLWIYPWLVFVGKWTVLAVLRPPLSLISLILLLSASFVATKFFLSRKWPIHWIQVSIIACGLIAIFLTVRIEYSTGFTLFSSKWFISYTQAVLDSFSHPHPIVFAIPVGLYLWWRGISLGRSTFYFANIYRSFLVGLAFLVLLIIGWGISAGAYSIQTMTSTIGVHVAGFFFFGLMAMALANLHAIQQRMKAKDGSAQAFGRRWLLVIIGVIGGLVLIGTDIASIFSSQMISFLGRVLNFTYELLTTILNYILIPVAFLVEWIVYIGRLIISWLTGGRITQPAETPEFLKPDNLQEGTQGSLSPEVILILKWTILTLILIAILYLLSRTIIRLRSSRAKDDVDEEQESLWSWGEFKSDVRLFFNMLRKRFERKKKPLSENPVPNRQADEDINIRLSIREIYQHLLRQTAQLGISRENYETPYEYARRLAKVIPDGKEPLAELTRLYVDVRYGERQMEDKKVDDANSLWRMLRIILFK